VRIVAFITGAAAVAWMLNHIGVPAEPPRNSPARGPPARDDQPIEAILDRDALAQPQPEHLVDTDAGIGACLGRDVVDAEAAAEASEGDRTEGDHDGNPRRTLSATPATPTLTTPKTPRSLARPKALATCRTSATRRCARR